MHSPLKKMRTLLPSFEGANRQLAEWYLNLLGQGAPLPHDHNSNDVARAVGVSRPTVIRFARALGYSGFPAMRNALLQSTAVRPSEDHKESPFADVADHYLHSIKLSLETVEPVAFHQATIWLAEAPTIFWLGWGDSFFAAASAEHKCYLSRMAARSANDFADLDMLFDQLEPKSVIVLISQSGRWSRIAESVLPHKERDVRVICCTGTAGSILSDVADITFVTSNPTYRVDDRPFTFRPAQLALIDALILAAARERGQYRVEEP